MRRFNGVRFSKTMFTLAWLIASLSAGVAADEATADPGQAAVHRDALAQQAYIKASNTVHDQQFGYAVATSADGNTLAVGARYESSHGTGINAEQTADKFCFGAGAVYIFRRVASTWSQQAFVKSSNTTPKHGQYFGASIALSADGNTLVVGAPRESSNATGINGDQKNTQASDAGAVYVFRYTASAWAQEAYVKASNTKLGQEFGHSVALSSDGDTLAVGAPGEASNATGVNHPKSNTLAEDAGAVYVFKHVEGAWSQSAFVKASNTKPLQDFGSSVALSSDGDTLAVGAPYGGADAESDADGPGDRDICHGLAYIFRFTRNSWAQQTLVRLPASDDDMGGHFGNSVALSSDGNTFAVGAPDRRLVSVYQYVNHEWSQPGQLRQPVGENSSFGTALALSADGNTLGVGAPRESNSATGIDATQTDSALNSSGNSYLFHRVDGAWSKATFVKASNARAQGWFGVALALSGDGHTFAIGSIGESSNATGINGNQADASASNAGAVYVFAN